MDLHNILREYDMKDPAPDFVAVCLFNASPQCNEYNEGGI